MRGLPNSPTVVLGGRIVGMGLTFFSAPILAQILGPAGRGIAASALAILTLLPVVVGLGLPLVIRRETTRPEGCAPAVRSARLVGLVAVVPCAGIGIGLASTLLGQAGTSVMTAFVLACCVSPAAVLWICDANILLAQHRLVSYSVINLISPAAMFFGALVGWAIGLVTVEYVILLNVLGTALTLTLTSALVRIPSRGPRTALSPLLRDGAKYIGSQVAEAASMRLDQGLAVLIIGASQAGYYSVAAAIAMVPYALGQAVGSAVYRQVAVAEDADRRDAHMAMALRYVALLTVLATLGLAAAVPWGIPWLFGLAFQGAVLPALCALCGSVAVSVGYVSSALLTALGRGWAMTHSQLLGLATGIGLLLVLGPSFGAVGAAVASSIGFVFATMLSVRAVGVPIGRFKWRDIACAGRLLVRGHIEDPR